MISTMQNQKRPGKIYSYQTKAGVIQYALAYNDEQSIAFTAYKKVFYHCFSDQHCTEPVLHHETGKKTVGVSHITALILIGFSD